jgi:CheY-like chemotaxis protein
VLRAGEHLLALINDVLDLQRVEEGRIVPEWQDVPLQALSARVNDLLSANARQRNVALVSRIAPGIAVRADERLLRQVLLNIASNAIKYNRSGGSVSWSAEAGAHGRVAIHIDDTGGGLTPQELARLFEPFERLGRETSTVEGTGLGLIIARRLCHAMGGSLDITSRNEVGTRATISLPIAQPAADQAAPARPPAPNPRAEPAAGARPLRMLYVEDNRINAILFEAAFANQDGYELRLAEDSKEALEQLTGWQPDVLVLDAHLPGMDGFELLRLLRDRPELADVPAFMCSADAMPEDIRRAEDAGFRGYWSKPINLARIISDLANIAPAPLHARP